MTAQQVDFVIDNYYEKSVKNAEMLKQQEYQKKDNTFCVHIGSADVKGPAKWKSYQSQIANKKSLLNFLFSHWKSCKVDREIDVYAKTESCCYLLHCMPGQIRTLPEVEELLPDHGEADTRIISHGAHASATVSSVVISSPDTDVAILAIAHHSKFVCTNVAILTGSKDKRRLLSVNNMTDQSGCKVTMV